jgi:predicted RNA-binding protein with PUA-like domain
MMTKATAMPLENQPISRLWLMKSEPDVFSWDMLVARGAKGEPWTGVRNYLARNHMQAMQVGDLVFFYHSNIGKEIVGIAKVITLAHPDQEDTTGTWACVDVAAVCPLPKPITLADVKADPMLEKMALVTSMRLSVQPVTVAEWSHICTRAGLDPTKLQPKPAKKRSA